MEKSIESIWKEGFMKNEANRAPKLNDLYNQKSKHLVDKLLRSFKYEEKLFLPIALFFFFGNLLIGNSFWSGIPGVLWVIAWYFVVKKQFAALHQVDKNANCYQFLVSIRENIKKYISTNVKLLATGTPLFLLPLVIYTYFNNLDKNMGQIFGIGDLELPHILLFLILPIATLFSVLVFKASLKAGYGKMLKKLDNLIADMEELKS